MGEHDWKITYEMGFRKGFKFGMQGSKADMVNMLTGIRDEIASNYLIDADTGEIISGTLPNFKAQKLLDSINNEIVKLKGEQNESE